MNKTYLVVGRGGTGKSSWVSKIQQQKLTLRDPDWSDQSGTFFPDEHFKGVDGVFIFCSSDSSLSHRDIQCWIRSSKRVCGDNISIVIVQNKIDLPEAIIYSRSKKYKRVKISALTGENITTPLVVMTKLNK